MNAWTSVAEALERSAEQHGLRPALSVSDTTLSYAQLWERVEVRAAQLSRTLSATERAVVLSGPIDLGLLLDLLATVLLGRPYLYLDAGWSRQRCQEVERLVGPDLSLSDLALLSTSGSSGAPRLVRKWVCLQQAEGFMRSFSDVRLACAVKPDHDLGLTMFVESEQSNEPAWRAGLSRELREDLPWSFVVRERLPMTPNGKVDVRTLTLEMTEPQLGVEEARSGLGPLLASSLEGLCRPVRVEDNFFALGGTSLLAAEGAARLSREHALELSLAALAGSSNLAELAEKVNGGQEFGRLHRLGSNSAEPSLLLLPGGYGTQVEFVALAGVVERLEAEVWAADCSPEPSGELDDLVKELATQLSSLDTLPTSLVGWCSGARTAAELSTVLRARGVSTRLILVDPPPPASGELARGLRRRRAVAREVLRALGQSCYHLGKLMKGAVRERTAHVNHLLRAANLVLRGRTWTPPEVSTKELDLIENAFSEMLRKTGWRPNASPADIFLTSDRWPQRMGWENLFPNGVMFHRLPGNHDDFLRKYQYESVAILNRHLKKR